MTAVVQINGNLYHALCAEAEKRNSTAPAVARALLRKIVGDGMLQEFLSTVDLSQHGKPSSRKRPYGENKRRKNYEWQGKRYNLPELAVAVGVPYSTLNNRLKHGMSLDDAIKAKKTDGDGESLLAIAKRTGMAYSTLDRRVRNGMSLEAAIAKPVDKRKARK